MERTDTLNIIVSLFAATLASLCVDDAVAADVPFSARSTVLVLNEDNDHYFKLDRKFMDIAHLEAYVDRLAEGGNVTHVFFCPTGQRASFDSKVWEPIWKGLEEYPREKIWYLFRQWSENAKLLNDNGIDPYAVWIARCRKNGISPWLAPRMNDCHDGAADLSKPYRSITLWRERKDLHCYPEWNKPDWGRHQFDYSHAEVRESALAMLRELFERYDFDGIELDGGIWFPKEKARASIPVMNAFIREVDAMRREWAGRRGHPILIGAKVSHSPESCRNQGCDVAKWVREGMVDWVICSNGGGNPIFDVPVDAWRKEFGERKDAKVICGSNYSYTPSHGMKRQSMTSAMYRGWADAMLTSGADGLYLFNLQYHPVEQAEVVRSGLAPASLLRHERFYHALGGMPVDMPGRGRIRFKAGSAATNGISRLVLAFKGDVPPIDAIAVSVNGCSPRGISSGKYVSWWREEIDPAERILPELYSLEFELVEGTVKLGANYAEISSEAECHIVAAGISSAPSSQQEKSETPDPAGAVGR